MEKSLYKKIKAKDCFTDFKHHASSWRNSKRIRKKSLRARIKELTNIRLHVTIEE